METAVSRGARGERLLWAGLLAAVLLSRGIDLGGGRAMGHDESMYSFYSWAFSSRGEYLHDPMMHGPLLYHLNALVFLVLGDSDFTARLVPAALGVGLVLLLFFFRPFLGARGAFCAALLVAVSPTLLFYSRYAIHDVYVAFLLLLWVLGVFRYLETGRRGPLWVTVIATALSFSVKANAYMNAAIIVSFLALAALERRRRHGRPLQDSRAAELAVLLCALTLPLASALGHRLLGSDPLNNTDPAGRAVILQVAGAFGLLSLLLAGAWFALRRFRAARSRSVLSVRLALLLAAVFWLIVTALHTGLFAQVARGFCSAVSGTLGYWMDQHGVGRGGQPVFFYLLILLLYEFLPFLLAAAGAVALARRGRGVFARRLPETQAPRSPLPGNGSRLFLLFTLWWTVWSLILYSFAGERMPWLAMHIVLPMCLLAGGWLGAASFTFRLREAWTDRTLFYALFFPLLFYLALQIPAGLPFQGRSSEDVLATMKWVRLLAGTLVLAGWVRFLRRRAGHVPWAEKRHMAAAGGVVLLLVLTIRAAYMLAFVNQEYARELLVYAHGSPDVAQTVRLVRQNRLAGTPAGERPPVAYGDEAAWPFSWHLRHEPAVFFGSEVPEDLFRAPLVLAGPSETERIHAARILPDDYSEIRRTLIWWPLQEYHGLTWKGLWSLLADPEALRSLWQYVAFRRTPGADPQHWPLRNDFFVLRETSPGAIVPARHRKPRPPVDWERALGPYRDVSARREITGPFANRRLRNPLNLTVAPDGGLAIADSGNHRIVLLDETGAFRGEIAGEAPPEGAGPFIEPAGVAVGQKGELFVADTWNGRIQVFGPDGRFLRAWGGFQTTHGQLGDPFVLYGPRGLAFDEEGNLLVADAGNCRILRYSAEGAFLQQAGGRGAGPGQLNEPVDIKFDAESRTFFVSDSWNERVQRLGGALEPLALFPVPAWDEASRLYKPYVAPGPGGVLFASVPARSFILVMDRDGSPLFHFGGLGRDMNRLATVSGLVVDRERNRLIAADSGNDRVLVFDLGEMEGLPR